MANPECFVARAGIVQGYKSGGSKLLQAIQMDTIKIKQITGDKLTQQMFKCEKKKRRKPKIMLSKQIALPAKVEANQNESKDKETKKSIEQIILNLKSSQNFPLDLDTLVKKKTEKPKPSVTITHGFRYHSNGDERLSRRPSGSRELFQPGEDNALNRRLSLTSQFVSTNAIEGFLWKNGRVNKSANDIPFLGTYTNAENIRSKYRALRATTSEVAGKPPGRDRSLQARSTPVLPYYWEYSSKYQPSLNRGNWNKGEDLFAGDRVTRSESNIRGNQNYRNSNLQPAKSSFNMRYGVTSQLFASRKSALDEYKEKEQERMSRTNKRIGRYIKSVQSLKKVAKASHQDILLGLTKYT